MTNFTDQQPLPFTSITDRGIREQHEIMERPFFSISKKRITALEYTSPDGKTYVHVSPHPEYGMATIWDYDIIIYLTSILEQMRKDGIQPIPRTVRVNPKEMLRAIKRHTGGKDYARLKQALDRLQTTSIKTNIRSGRMLEEHRFSIIESWSAISEDNIAYGIEVTVSKWFLQGSMMQDSLLQISSKFFSITGGFERWLYKIGRKHAGGAGPKGFVFTFKTLHAKSGTEATFARFKHELLKIAAENNVPELDLSVQDPKSPDPRLRIVYAKDAALPFAQQPQVIEAQQRKYIPPPETSSLDERAAAHWFQKAKEDFPGWDHTELKRLFDAFLKSKNETLNHANEYAVRFYGFVKAHDHKNRYLHDQL